MITIIPAIDIINGKCVRLTKGDYTTTKVYNEDPVEMARAFEDAGFKRLHLVDLNGAKASKVQNLKVLEKIASKTNFEIDFSGGISSEEQVSSCFSAGAAIISIGSIAVKDSIMFSKWIEKFGTEKFMLAADVKQENVVIKGWTENAEFTIYELLDKYSLIGLNRAFCTDVSKDGMLEGPSIELYKNIISNYPKLNLSASGGVASIKDIEQLDQIGCDGVIIGKAFYEGLINPKDLRNYVN